MANSSFLAAAAAAASSASNNFGSGGGGSPNFQAEAARQFLHQLTASHALNPPAQVDLRESSVAKSELGVWANEKIPAGTRFGPFMGKWTMEATNPKYAWEVRKLLPINYHFKKISASEQIVSPALSPPEFIKVKIR